MGLATAISLSCWSAAPLPEPVAEPTSDTTSHHKVSGSVPWHAEAGPLFRTFTRVLAAWRHP